MTSPIHTYPDGDYQYVSPEVLRTGDAIRINHVETHSLSTTSQPVTYISKPIQTENLIIVETIRDSEEHQIRLWPTTRILRRVPTLPTEHGATIFIDELVPQGQDEEFIPGTLAQYSKIDGLWNWFHLKDWTHCESSSADILKWRPAYVTDKAPTA